MNQRHLQKRAVAVCIKFVMGLTEMGKLYNLHIPNGLYDPEDDEDCLIEDDEDKFLNTERFISFKKSKKNCTTLRLTDLNTYRSFIRFFVVLSMVNSLSISGRTMSLRDVYYAEKSHFCSQKQCNDTILSVGMVLGLRRHEMGIVPAARGLVCGLIRFRFHCSKSVEREDDMASKNDLEECKDEKEDPNAVKICSDFHWVTVGKEQEGEEGSQESLISSLWSSTPYANIEVQLGMMEQNEKISWYNPSACNDLSLSLPRHLVIVEKEGIFRRLQEDQFHLHKLPSVLVTGCGFPDVATRSFVTKLCQICPDLKAVGLCDYNPYGLALLLTYREDEDRLKAADAIRRSRFETAGLGVDLHWLGFRSSHIGELQIRLHESAFQPLTTRDRQQLRSLSSTSKVLNDPNYLHEVEAMEKGGIKCELQAFYGLGIEHFSSWLQSAILSQEYI